MLTCKPNRPMKVLLPAAVFFALPVLPATAKPAPVPPIQRQLQDIYNKINAAAAQKDADTVCDYDDSDFVIINTKGQTVDASQGRQDLEELLTAVDTFKGVTVIQSFTGTDTDATVTVKDHVVLSAANQVTGRAIKITVNDVTRDYWVKTADGWKRKRSRIISGKGVFRKNF